MEAGSDDRVLTPSELVFIDSEQEWGCNLQRGTKASDPWMNRAGASQCPLRVPEF